MGLSHKQQTGVLKMPNIQISTEDQELLDQLFSYGNHTSQPNYIDELYNSKDPKKLNLLKEELTEVSLGPMNRQLVKEFTNDILKLQGKNILKGRKTK